MAAVDYFLKIEGIEGESQDAKHPKEIDLESWSWGESQSGSPSPGGGGGAGKVSMQDFNFVMRLNKASPKLLLACASGQHLTKAVLTCRKGGRDEFMKITFTDVQVSSFQTAGSRGDIVPTDAVSINFAKLEYEYKEQKPDGTLGVAIKVGWDVKRNVAV